MCLWWLFMSKYIRDTSLSITEYLCQRLNTCLSAIEYPRQNLHTSLAMTECQSLHSCASRTKYPRPNLSLQRVHGWISTSKLSFLRVMAEYPRQNCHSCVSTTGYPCQSVSMTWYPCQSPHSRVLRIEFPCKCSHLHTSRDIHANTFIKDSCFHWHVPMTE